VPGGERPDLAGLCWGVALDPLVVMRETGGGLLIQNSARMRSRFCSHHFWAAPSENRRCEKRTRRSSRIPCPISDVDMNTPEGIITHVLPVRVRNIMF